MSDLRSYKRLECNKTYEMWVVEIIENRRQFPKDNKVFYIHDILLKDDGGFYYKPEYVTLTPTQDFFVSGQKQKFTCTLTGRCDEIIPVVGPPVSPTGWANNDANNSDLMQVAGTTYSQGLTLATQIKCAECTSLGVPIVLDDLFDLASKMEHWLMDRKEMYG